MHLLIIGKLTIDNVIDEISNLPGYTSIPDDIHKILQEDIPKCHYKNIADIPLMQELPQTLKEMFAKLQNAFDKLNKSHNEKGAFKLNIIAFIHKKLSVENFVEYLYTIFQYDPLLKQSLITQLNTLVLQITTKNAIDINIYPDNYKKETITEFKYIPVGLLDMPALIPISISKPVAVAVPMQVIIPIVHLEPALASAPAVKRKALSSDKHLQTKKSRNISPIIPDYPINSIESHTKGLKRPIPRRCKSINIDALF